MVFFIIQMDFCCLKKKEVQSPCGRFVYIEKWHLAARGQRNLFHLKKNNNKAFLSIYTYVYCVFSADNVSRVFYHFENTTPSFLRQVLKLWSTEMSKVKDKRQKF